MVINQVFILLGRTVNNKYKTVNIQNTKDLKLKRKQKAGMKLLKKKIRYSILIIWVIILEIVLKHLKIHNL